MEYLTPNSNSRVAGYSVPVSKNTRMYTYVLCASKPTASN